MWRPSHTRFPVKVNVDRFSWVSKYVENFVRRAVISVIPLTDCGVYEGSHVWSITVHKYVRESYSRSLNLRPFFHILGHYRSKQNLSHFHSKIYDKRDIIGAKCSISYRKTQLYVSRKLAFWAFQLSGYDKSQNQVSLKGLGLKEIHFFFQFGKFFGSYLKWLLKWIVISERQVVRKSTDHRV